MNEKFWLLTRNIGYNEIPKRIGINQSALYTFYSFIVLLRKLSKKHMNRMSSIMQYSEQQKWLNGSKCVSDGQYCNNNDFTGCSTEFVLCLLNLCLVQSFWPVKLEYDSIKWTMTSFNSHINTPLKLINELINKKSIGGQCRCQSKSFRIKSNRTKQS